MAKEYWVIYRGPGFLAVVIWQLPHPLSPLKVSSTGDTGRLRKGDNLQLADGSGGEMVGVGDKFYDGDKAWSSINHLILSVHGVYNAQKAYLLFKFQSTG